MKKLKQCFVYALTAGFLLSPLACSNPMNDLNPEVRVKVEKYEDSFKKLKPEERKDFVEYLERSLAISEQQHKEDISNIVEAFKEYQEGDKGRGYLVLLPDKDYEDYKKMVFNSKGEIVSFLLDTEKHAAVKVSEDNILMVHYHKKMEQGKGYILLIDHNINGMHEGEEDSVSVIITNPEAIAYYNFENAHQPTKEMDEAKSVYKIITHEIAKIKNETNLGALIEKYRRELIEKYYGENKSYFRGERKLLRGKK